MHLGNVHAFISTEERFDNPLWNPGDLVINDTPTKTFFNLEAYLIHSPFLLEGVNAAGLISVKTRFILAEVAARVKKTAYQHTAYKINMPDMKENGSVPGYSIQMRLEYDKDWQDCIFTNFDDLMQVIADVTKEVNFYFADEELSKKCAAYFLKWQDEAFSSGIYPHSDSVKAAIFKAYETVMPADLDVFFKEECFKGNTSLKNDKAFHKMASLLACNNDPMCWNIIITEFELQ